ncbi:GNAT family N-acetyltransferase [Methylomonas sp. AM2-LC]|uniref:GNAT family N-acetyltransferase n=1 Tax=Methylomonas sp. AM2-LC TaxID=3153301 RepID=UPI003267F5D0
MLINTDTNRQLSTTIDQVSLSDIAPIFNLIQDYSAQGYFNNFYLQPRYQAGLGIQLFSMLLLDRIRLPDGSWHKTHMRVAKISHEVVGFIIMRRLPGSKNRHEIYMCAVDELHCRQGLGNRLIKKAIVNLEEDAIIVAECLPKARPMKQLLHSIGLKSVRKDIKNGIEKFEGCVANIKFYN